MRRTKGFHIPCPIIGLEMLRQEHGSVTPLFFKEYHDRPDDQIPDGHRSSQGSYIPNNKRVSDILSPIFSRKKFWQGLLLDLIIISFMKQKDVLEMVFSILSFEYFYLFFVLNVFEFDVLSFSSCRCRTGRCILISPNPLFS